MITIEQLKQIVNRRISESELALIHDSLNQTFEKYDINTNLRINHFLAQLLHESGCFRYKYEIWGKNGGTSWQKRYEGRKDLGNVIEGDGYKFRGRGFIQLTGRANYTEATKYFNQDFISNPDMVAEYPYNCLVAGWFWQKRKINKYADQDNIEMATRRVNGGLNGFDDRKKWYKIVKQII